MDFIPNLGYFKTNFSFEEKFKLFSFSDVFELETYASLQNSFDTLKWKKKETHFYKQYSSTISPDDSNPFAGLFHPIFFQTFKKKLEFTIGIRLRNCVSMVAHKLVTSQEIGVHNDYCDPDIGYENFRFIFQFARKNQLRKGGDISFLRSENKNDIIKNYQYTENFGICFEITPFSYHFVAPVEGERHTLVMYLWALDQKYDGSGIEVAFAD